MYYLITMHHKYELIENKENKQISVTNRLTIGLYEYIEINKEKILARIDTGAVKSSIDSDLAVKLNLGPIIGSKKVRNVHGSTIRPIVKGTLKLVDKQIEASFTLQSRKGMNFQVLIGQNILKKGFIIDPNKNLLISKE